MSSTETKNGNARRGEPASQSAAEAVGHVREHGASCVIDVRTPIEVSAEKIAGAMHIPLDELPSRLADVQGIEGLKLLLCRSGKRAAMAREALQRAGIDDVVVIEGGIVAYANAGGATVKGDQRMSLERQVRIAAGSLVLVGSILGFLVHPAFYGLSAFVGAGLVFAGVTDYCGMGLLLAKMPWNRAAS